MHTFPISLKDKNVWITGASRGIGRACALAFAQAGANIAISYHKNQSKAEETALLCSEFKVKTTVIQCDVSISEICKNSYEKIRHDLGPIHILVNNAGIIKDDLFIMSEFEDWAKLFQTNVFGSLYCMQIAAKDMMLEKFGRIINITSSAATKGGRGQAIYAATKGAIEAATRSLAVELGRKGINLNSIAPGVIETDLSEEIRKLAHDEILQRQIIKRFGKPEEIAAWALMLSSEYGDFITGQTIHIDGGLKMP